MKCMKYEYLIDKAPKVNTCCCGCELELGCLIIGWFQVIISILALIGYVAVFVTFIATVATIQADVDISIYGIILTIISAIETIIMLVLACYLLLGINQDDMQKVEIWLQGELILLLFYIVLFILYIIGACFTVGLMIGQVIYELIEIGLACYWIVVVKSYYYEKTSATPTPTDVEYPTPPPVEQGTE